MAVSKCGMSRLFVTVRVIIPDSRCTVLDIPIIGEPVLVQGNGDLRFLGTIAMIETEGEDEGRNPTEGHE